ncbi:MAG: 3-phosphoshikimate 1-carboxyvinyltransferase [Clostridiaceae bacterium]|nr:3-phosphoshikimate 1-carboxyvinyltransferase [Clostridiaceae bacterium]
MDITLHPRKVKGTITPPPSKSDAHRLIICAGLCEGGSVVKKVQFSKDISATICALKKMGAQIDIDNDNVIVKKGIDKNFLRCEIDCIESGSTLRFMIPISLLSSGAKFLGRGRLMQRPLEPYFEIFEKLGIRYEKGDGYLDVEGKLTSGSFHLRGDISSQFVTGLLFALPNLEGDSEIVTTTPLESKGYVDMTIDSLKKFGVKVENEGYRRFYIKGGQKFLPKDVEVEKDYSQAAFFIVANALGADIEIKDLNEFSKQKDKEIIDIINLVKSGVVSEIDVSDIPDLVPVLAVFLALQDGKHTKIINAKRLRMKESDRLFAICDVINSLGGKVLEFDDGLSIFGVKSLKGGVVSSHNDHRIAMSAAVASIKCENPVTILNAECVEKSYPEFFDDFKSLIIE